MQNSEFKNKFNIQERTLDFASEIIKFSNLLPKSSAGVVVSRQIIRSGTSIGSNAQEASDGSSKKDFIQKLLISLREARETDYWLNVIIKSELLNNVKVEPIKKELNEIIAVLVTIIKKAKANS